MDETKDWCLHQLDSLQHPEPMAKRSDTTAIDALLSVVV